MEKIGLFKKKEKKKTESELIAEEIQRRKENIASLEQVIADNNKQLQDLKDVYINERPTVYHTSISCSHIKPNYQKIKLVKARSLGLSVCSHCDRG